MTSNPEVTPTVESAPIGSNEPSKKGLLLGFVIALVAMAGIMLALTTMSAADYPYTGAGVVKSHTPWGSALCQINVTESNGTDHLYQRTGGLPYCQGVEDGAKVEVKLGTISSITAH